MCLLYLANNSGSFFTPAYNYKCYYSLAKKNNQWHNGTEGRGTLCGFHCQNKRFVSRPPRALTLFASFFWRVSAAERRRGTGAGRRRGDGRSGGTAERRDGGGTERDGQGQGQGQGGTGRDGEGRRGTERGRDRDRDGQGRRGTEREGEREGRESGPGFSERGLTRGKPSAKVQFMEHLHGFSGNGENG